MMEERPSAMSTDAIVALMRSDEPLDDAYLEALGNELDRRGVCAWGDWRRVSG